MCKRSAVTFELVDVGVYTKVPTYRPSDSCALNTVDADPLCRRTVSISWVGTRPEILTQRTGLTPFSTTAPWWKDKVEP